MIWVIFIQLVPDAVIFKDKKLSLANQGENKWYLENLELATNLHSD